MRAQPGSIEVDDSVNEFAAEGLDDQIILFRQRLYLDPEFKEQAAALRRFNRFYFHRMRPLKAAMTDFGFHPSELRVIREIGEAPQGVSANYIAWKLHMEQARVSRVLSFFKALEWITEEKDPKDGRVKTIRLSPAGSDMYRRLDRQAEAWAELMLRLVLPKERDRLLHAMAEIQQILGTVRI